MGDFCQAGFSLNNSMTLRQLAKKIIGFAGLKVYPLHRFPWGIDLEQDLKRLLPGNDGWVIFDVGANVGQTVQRLFPFAKTGQFYAFEPVAKTYTTLLTNTSGFKHLQPFQLALGNEDGEVLMEIRESSEWNRIWKEDDAAENTPTEKVKISRLDSFCTEHHVEQIDLLKLDCEGFELEVLKGSERMLSQGLIRAVYSEVNFLRNNSHGDYFQINDFLTAHGYYFFANYDYHGWGRNFSGCVYCNGLWLKLENP